MSTYFRAVLGLAVHGAELIGFGIELVWFLTWHGSQLRHLRARYRSFKDKERSHG